MPILPPTVSAVSGSLASARQRTLQLYRQWQKSVPEIVQQYRLDYPLSRVRSRVRQEFERHRYVTDVRVIDVLLLKGTQELHETMNLWKQDSHLHNYFNADVPKGQEVAQGAIPKREKPFLQRFFEGRD